MIRPTIALIALASFTFVAAQFTINPDEVSDQTRASWCTAETNNCQLLCGSVSALSNTCGYSDLSFNCTCANGTAPGLQYYQGTMPTFICNQAFSDCINANENNQAGQMNCTANIQDKCGKLIPTSADASTTTSSSASGLVTTTAASNQASSPAAAVSTPASSASSSSSHAAAPTNAAFIGNGIAAVAAGLAAALL